MIPPYPPDDRFTTSFSCRATYISPITTTTRGQRRKKILGEREVVVGRNSKREGGGDMSRQSKQLKSINRPKRTVCGPTQGVGGITRVPVDEDRSKRRASEEEEEKLGRWKIQNVQLKVPIGHFPQSRGRPPPSSSLARSPCFLHFDVNNEDRERKMEEPSHDFPRVRESHRGGIQPPIIPPIAGSPIDNCIPTSLASTSITIIGRML